MAVVPIRLTKEQLRKIALLIKLGIYSNRSQAIKSILNRSMDIEVQHHLRNPRVEGVVQALLALKEIQEPIKLITRKTAAELIAEGRN